MYNQNTMTTNNLMKCSRCHSEMLEEYFDISRKGLRNKCCKFCLVKYQCDRCEFTSSTKSVMSTHIKIVHDKIKDNECPNDNCDFKCSTKNDLTRHIKMVHDKIKDFECPNDNCDFKCFSNSNLTRHIKMIHDKIKDIECPNDNCDYKCSIKSSLKVHIKMVHDKIKDFECPNDDCDYKCSTNAHLKVHIKMVHDKIKDFECPTDNCDYKCSQKSSLKVHIKTCTGKFTGSSGEYEILKLLDELDQHKDEDFLYDQTFWSVKDKSLLRWDFIINHKHNPLVIEYDGAFHYQPIRMGGMTDAEAQTAFENIQRRDKIKNDYCNENGIPMLRIPYWDKEKIESLVMDFISQNL